MYKVIWNENEIGELSDMQVDMWYLDGKWKTYSRRLSIEFEEKVRSLDINETFHNPVAEFGVILQHQTEPQHKLYCLVMGIEGQTLTLRQLIAEEALDMFFPNR